MQKFRNLSLADKIFYALVTLLLTAVFIVVLYPCVFVISASFSSGDAVQAGKVVLFPVDFTLEGYKTVFNTPGVWIGFRNSLFYTVAHTLLSVALTITAAYCLSRKDVPGSKFIMLMFTFTMFFSGGMIPNYMLMRDLGFLNTVWAVIIPGSITAYNLIVARTFIRNSIPEELMEAAMLDGCSDFRYFTDIVLPLSKAVIAVLVLYYGVAQWNAYFNPMIYLTDKNLYPLTIFLKEILISSNIDPSTLSDPESAELLVKMASIIKYALIVVSMVPVMLIYPFVQKYFVKGVMIGSVKG